ncbi:MAG TPA: class I SAM-dependent methyltransferase [Gemmataceae bacterium]|nr:class I SAM-dependent methyltransferase [Gemmataceae bacterium]
MIRAPQTAPMAESPRPQVTWEDAACPLCHGRHWSPLIEAQDSIAGSEGLWFAVVQCDSCGMCYTNPRPDVATVSQFYPPHYSPHEAKPHRQRSVWSKLKFWNQPRVEKRPIPWHGQRRLLDFGCGNGSYMQIMQRRGWTVTGLDVSERMVERIRNELGLNAFVGTLPHLDLEPESFDVITMWHALEHLHDPLPVLREARSLLVRGGKIVISVPNIDSWPFRWFGRNWFALELPRHLSHFMPATLAEMVERAGFAVEPIQMVRHSDWIRFSARLACQRPQAMLWQKALTYNWPARLAGLWCYMAGQSDCILAVGHR